MNINRNIPDPEGLAIARDMQERLKPAQVILQGSRATGDHRPDSDVDLMAVCADSSAVKDADETLRQLLEGKYEVPVVNVITITREEFLRTVPLAQSPAGQAARHGVTPEGRGLDYRTGRKPEAEEVRQAAFFWLVLAEVHLDGFNRLLEHEWLSRTHIPAFEGQTALERAFKGLLTAGNDEARFRRDAAVMWRHFESAIPIRDRDGADAMASLLAATKGTDEQGCSLTRFTEAFRRGDIVPDPTGSERRAIGLHLAPAVNALISEALDRAGATRDELCEEKLRRRGRPGTGPATGEQVDAQDAGASDHMTPWRFLK